MSNVMIRVQNLSKKYILAHQNEGVHRYKTFRGAIANSAKSLGSIFNPRIENAAGSSREEFWALRDLSFEIERGDCVGIVGRNGAGKSTLLKLLSRITEPTSGAIEIKGRVASLLEVGTGFHPELTGRENIFLNGAILGMSRVEIQRKFDEIVDFAEVEKFLDTPVKRYSSGMYVRLAFAVAAHLEPEILIVDEVLAVGDTQFQKKCLGKMGDVATKEGRTVLFVSHNMSAIKKLCDRGILLEKGGVKIDGNAYEAVDGYLRSSSDKVSTRKIVDSGSPSVIEVAIVDELGNPVETLDGRKKYSLKLKLFSGDVSDLMFGFTVFNSEDIGVFSGLTSDRLTNIPLGLSELSIELPISLLHPGYYRVEGALSDSVRSYEQNECYTAFTCLRDESFYLRGFKSKGLIRVNNHWQLDLVKPLSALESKV